MTASVDSLLLESAARAPGDPAIAFREEELSFEDLDRSVDRFSARLLEHERSLAGARVAIVAPNAPALVIAMFAAWRAGAVVVPLSARMKEYELRQISSDARPTVLVSIASHGGYSFADLVPSLMQAVPTLRTTLIVDERGEVADELTQAGEGEESERLDSDIAAILYTSGTTGDPKGVFLTHASAVHTARQLGALIRLSSDDTSVLVIPASHAFGLGCLLAGIASGSRTSLVDSSFSLEPLLGAVARHRATVLHGSPTLFFALLKARPQGLDSVHSGFVAGSACPPELIERLDATGITILNVFGMTEIGAASACRHDDPLEIRCKTIGRPLPGYEFRVAPAEGEDAEAREAGLPALGELQVRSPYVTPGYYERPDLTAEAFEGDWFRTGDLGFIDEGGHVVISGRSKELVHVGGFNVFPAEVENFLLTHPDVEQAAVVGMPHERMGEALHAFVVKRPGSALTPPELLRFARERIAGYKLPYAIEIVADLPRLTSGKPDRSALTRAASGVNVFSA